MRSHFIHAMGITFNIPHETKAPWLESIRLRQQNPLQGSQIALKAHHQNKILWQGAGLGCTAFQKSASRRYL